MIDSEQSVSSSSRPKVGFVSLGCPKNLVDSEVMMGLLDSAGAQMTNDASEAEILVVNTCSFIDKAKQESVDTILEMAQHKVDGKARRLIVAGCLVERYRDEIRKNIPEVDAVVGTGELEAILAAAGLSKPAPVISEPSPFTILTAAEAAAATATSIEFRAEGDLREQQGRFSRSEWDGAESSALPQYLYDHTTPRLLATGKTSAYIKIAEGCDHPCAFCVIPNLRGKFRSRRFESVVAEAESLVAQGVREIVLIGQDTTCYGEDMGLKDGLAQLLDRLAQIPDLKWLRFLYAYPNKITGKLLETIAKHDKIVKYLDVPLQHAAGPVLKSMKRGANADIFLKTVAKVREAVPGIALRTSFIVGFPGETEEDFETLCNFVRAAKFDWLGVFTYSDEEGSKAFDFGEKVPPRVIEQRRKKLMKLQQGISKKAKQNWVGRELDVLVEGESEETPLLWEGRSEFHAPEIDGTVYINDFGPFEELTPGRFYRCEITEAHDYDVVARIVSEV
ncbi:30S ribosomal protein S12 methylthiotransferase RimO [Silvibacterium dinghuense]|uniref:Ribosomal protein uS12 methylthiotransferase RimO n=1 Tax=Silvibacterium dinghuense TaxID=1560006 RepID=A0A4Q1SBX2_9BACT|nr:30S ribosomal protein S12 methylthiotransferase RimO [Silvibacterium dinghuense]RXS94654.1 30S ribosomal protein S12 methylthiotransferase RimO [Silvibacterium dinghuense]